MKAYVFKNALGEYDSYSEEVRYVYLVDDSTPDIAQLEIKWKQFIKEEKVKAKESSKRWTKNYVIKSGFLFEDWFAKNYSAIQLNFSEHINYE